MRRSEAVWADARMGGGRWSLCSERSGRGESGAVEWDLRRMGWEYVRIMLILVFHLIVANVSNRPTSRTLTPRTISHVHLTLFSDPRRRPRLSTQLRHSDSSIPRNPAIFPTTHTSHIAHFPSSLTSPSSLTWLASPTSLPSRSLRSLPSRAHHSPPRRSEKTSPRPPATGRVSA